MVSLPCISAVKYSMSHVPGLVRYGYKPSLDILKNRYSFSDLNGASRSFDEAVSYLPNQVFMGGSDPQILREHPRPWYKNSLTPSVPTLPFGNILREDDFLLAMKTCDVGELLWLEADFLSALLTQSEKGFQFEYSGHEKTQIVNQIENRGSLGIYGSTGEIQGCINAGSVEDEALSAISILENLAAKTSSYLALQDLLSANGIDPASIDYVLSSGEEAVGDSYQRGGGNIAKAIGEQCGLINATGSDVKAFCCAPIHALIIGASLISSGLFKRVAVVGGCSVPKLGMNFDPDKARTQGIPLLEDVLPGFAVLIEADDGFSPILDLDSVGRHYIGAGSSLRAITRTLVSEPLSKLGLGFSDIDKFALELQNPDITESSGGGDVTERNYRFIAALASQNGEIARSEISSFVEKHGMPGFSSTQGHIASAVPYLAHSVTQLTSGSLNKVMFIAKGSLFLGRMTTMSDGMSFILRRQ